MSEFKNPVPTVDILIFVGYGPTPPDDRFIVIKRKNPPHGWALPGGFVDEGESFEDAARREALEETGLEVLLTEQFHTYSDPKRDPRKHIVSTLYLAVPVVENAVPKAADDATEFKIVSLAEALADLDLVFDHRQMIHDVNVYNGYGVRPSLMLK